MKPVLRDGRWFAELPDGAIYPWDDLREMFSIPYRTGPVKPVTRPGEDPGRIRFDPLFRAVYGHEAREVERQLVPVTINGQRLPVHARVKPAFERLSRRLGALMVKDPSIKPYLEALGGTFNWRTVANSDRLSPHSFGVSLDINVKRSHYWEWQKEPGPPKWQNGIPQALVDAFEAEGFIWGGRWYHYDTMHFEYRPELLDPACAG
ncbi:MAG: M15 family metallopeptidase [Myxococcaceae bacterium]|nr:M15 family metallopeptidase [Myxococcaceae bacterium]